MKLYIQNVVLIVVHCVVPHTYIMSAGKNVLIEKLRLNVLQRFSSSMSSLFLLPLLLKSMPFLFTRGS
jgi:hypothetical protein